MSEARLHLVPVRSRDAKEFVRPWHQQVYVVATLAREDSGLHHGYRDTFHLPTECHRIASELGLLATTSHPTFDERRGEGRAGFQQIQGWHDRRHRLPTPTQVADQVAIASHAAEMLRAARYGVDLAPRWTQPG
ncbi:hypothetical protein ACWC9R_12210 [Streptomyces sp. NPDC001219]